MTLAETVARSRRRGRGALYRYKTAAGERWRWQLYVPVDADEPDGEQRRVGGGGFRTMDDADDALREAVRKLRAQEVFATKGAPAVAAFAEQWLAGLELAPSTLQGYRKIVRNHIAPHVGRVQVDKLTATRIARLYRELREDGRRDSVGHGQPLSANSVQKIHVVLGAILQAAVDDGLITTNPARRTRTVKAPTGKTIRAARPEITAWSARELTAFLVWDRDVYDDDLFALWRTIAYTGMRRSEALALRWSDVDFDGGRLSIRRAADVTTRNAVKTTKSGRSRAIDLDEPTVALLRSWRALRGTIALSLARPDAYVFGNLSGEVRSPNEVGRRWTRRVAAAQTAVPELSRITLKGLRHTHATLLLEAGVHPKVVQERLGHASVMITMDIYSHVTPTVQKAAVDRFSALLGGA
ncbi:site-specific recombinase XerD [Amnibacterium kyonggiense]|uniref:Site-specific recombinase XerD n=1 Tax=Amnibacterium kyonggiense TaxID=595671 RepID=A0A4R7FP69_9MICO|nr:site-specific recombinase XerD [Amnibacterium kyonggiense]